MNFSKVFGYYLGGYVLIIKFLRLYFFKFLADMKIFKGLTIVKFMFFLTVTKPFFSSVFLKSLRIIPYFFLVRTVEGNWFFDDNFPQFNFH